MEERSGVRPPGTDSIVGPMRIATLSLDVRVGDVRGNLRAALDALAWAADQGAHVAALPEMWPTSFTAEATDGELAESDAAVLDLARAAAAHGVAVVGSSYGPRGGPRDLPSNRAHVLEGGDLCAHHDKVHLFTPTAEHFAFRAGEAPPPVVPLGPERALVSPLVCYDLRFPSVARMAFRAGAEVLAVVAQWPEQRAPHWRALVRGRAAELEGFVVGCNRGGTDEVGRRRMVLAFDPGMSGASGPAGEDLGARVEATLPARGQDRAPTRAALFELDLEAARALRRAVPVHADERVDLAARWWTGAASEDHP